jgi:hypothetical protein
VSASRPSFAYLTFADDLAVRSDTGAAGAARDAAGIFEHTERKLVAGGGDHVLEGERCGGQRAVPAYQAQRIRRARHVGAAGAYFRTLSVEEMAEHRWHFPAPGARAIHGDVSTVATDILERCLSIRAALTKTQATLQQRLDAAPPAAP